MLEIRVHHRRAKAEIHWHSSQFSTYPTRQPAATRCSPHSKPLAVKLWALTRYTSSRTSIHHACSAVVALHYRARERTSFELVRSLRAIRPSVPIILLCREQIGPLPSGMDASGVYFYDAAQPRERLTFQVRRLLTAEGTFPDVDDTVHCGAA